MPPEAEEPPQYPQFPHDSECEAVIVDTIYEQMVLAYLYTVEGRKKLIDSLVGARNDNLTTGFPNCLGCRARFCSTWMRVFTLMGPAEWDPSAGDLYRLLKASMAEWEDLRIPKPVVEPVQRPEFVEHLLQDPFKS